MIYLIKWLLGLCRHDFEPYKVEDVGYNGLEGGLQAIDLKQQKVVKYRAFTMCCRNCGKVKVQKVYR